MEAIFDLERISEAIRKVEKFSIYVVLFAKLALLWFYVLFSPQFEVVKSSIEVK